MNEVLFPPSSVQTAAANGYDAGFNAGMKYAEDNSTRSIMRARIAELIAERDAVEKREYEAQGTINELRTALQGFMKQQTVREATQSTDIGLSNAADKARALIARMGDA